jgi:hypothetical protein
MDFAVVQEDGDAAVGGSGHELLEEIDDVGAFHSIGVLVLGGNPASPGAGGAEDCHILFLGVLVRVDDGLTGWRPLFGLELMRAEDRLVDADDLEALSEEAVDSTLQIRDVEPLLVQGLELGLACSRMRLLLCDVPPPVELPELRRRERLTQDARELACPCLQRHASLRHQRQPRDHGVDLLLAEAEELGWPPSGPSETADCIITPLLVGLNHLVDVMPGAAEHAGGISHRGSLLALPGASLDTRWKRRIGRVVQGKLVLDVVVAVELAEQVVKVEVRVVGWRVRDNPVLEGVALADEERLSEAPPTDLDRQSDRGVGSFRRHQATADRFTLLNQGGRAVVVWIGFPEGGPLSSRRGDRCRVVGVLGNSIEDGIWLESGVVGWGGKVKLGH